MIFKQYFTRLDSNSSAKNSNFSVVDLLLGGNQYLQQEIPAIARLLGYKKHTDNSFEICLPTGLDFLDAAKAINNAAEKARLTPVLMLDLCQCNWWNENESLYEYSTDRNVVYRMIIDTGSYNLSRIKQASEKRIAPIGAIALAEAVEQLLSNGKSSLLKTCNRSSWVRGLTPRVILDLSPKGIYVRGGIADCRDGTGISAGLILSSNPF